MLFKCIRGHSSITKCQFGKYLTLWGVYIDQHLECTAAKCWSKYTTLNVPNDQIHGGPPKVQLKFFVNQFLCVKSLRMKFVLRDLIAETISAVFFFSSKVDKMWVVAMLDFSFEFCSFLALRIKNKDIIIFEVIRKTALIYSWRGGGNSLQEWN